MSKLLEAIEIETAPNPRWSVIWMHGLGADGSDFVPIVPELGLKTVDPIRFVFPHAPVIPVTCNNGYAMRAWYDIYEIGSITRRVDEAGIKQNREAIRQLIARENERGVPCERIILAGFSQGGAMAYTAGLTHPEKLAGIIALSTYIPSVGLIEADATDANKATPILAAHGTLDPIVPVQMGDIAAKFAKNDVRQLEWHTWPMQHSVCPQEIDVIGKWLRARISGTAA